MGMHTGTQGSRSGNRGFTLIEAIIALVILAAATAGVLLVFAETAARSADPMIRAQAQSIAIAYMDEILLQPYNDPDGSDAGETRPTYDDIHDYNGISQSPTDRTNTPIGALSDYTVTVDVTAGPPAVITVNVTHTSGKVDYDLVSEREDY